MISITNNLTTSDGMIIDSIKDYQSKYIELMNIAFDKVETIKDMHGNIFVKQKPVDTKVEIERRTISTEYLDRPKGKWLYKYNRVYECDQCGASFDNWSNELQYKNYCPNCGAKMEVDP